MAAKRENKPEGLRELKTDELAQKLAVLTEERFRQGLVEFADHAVEQGAPNLLVDLREFAYSPAPDMWEWRLVNIIPRYQEAGVRKFANVVPEGWPVEEPRQAEG